MELDQFKTLWQQDIPDGKTDRQAVRELLTRKSNSAVSRMKRNLRIELWLIITTYGGTILFYFLAWKGKLSEVAWFLLFVGLVFIIYYNRKNKLLNEMECLNCQVRNNLKRQVSLLDKYVRFYLIGGTLLIPVALIFFGWVLHEKLPSRFGSSIFYPSPGNPLWKAILAWSLLSFAVTILFYYLNRWYVRKLYGNHIRKLKTILKEMENDQDA